MRNAVLLAAGMMAACLGCNGSDEHRHRRDRGPHVGQPPARRHPASRGRDAYEPNDDRDRPSRIELGETQAHTISPAGDEDWLLCRVPGPGRYRIEFVQAAETLDVDVWVGRRGRDRDEDRVESFEVRRAGSHGVRVRPGAGYVKLRIRAEDDDRRGRYAVAIHRR